MSVDSTKSVPPLKQKLLETVRACLATVSPSLDVAAVDNDTPLGALFFDSFMVLKFIAALEPMLGAQDFPFEDWIREHAERTDRLTVGALVDWLATRPEIRDWASNAPG